MCAYVPKKFCRKKLVEYTVSMRNKPEETSQDIQRKEILVAMSQNDMTMGVKSSKKSDQLFFKEQPFWEPMRGKEAKNSLIQERSFEDEDGQARVFSIRFPCNQGSGLFQIISISGRASLYFCKQLNSFIHNLSLHLNMALRGHIKGLGDHRLNQVVFIYDVVDMKSLSSFLFFKQKKAILSENEASLPRMYSAPQVSERENPTRIPEGTFESFSCPPARNKRAFLYSGTSIWGALV